MDQNSVTHPSTPIILPPFEVHHREEEYDQGMFAILSDMQERHFWYRGRHKFLLAAVDRYALNSKKTLAAIDLGGGVGGWINYLNEHRSRDFHSLALGDSSLVALRLAEAVLPSMCERHQLDLTNLHMHDQWDVAFLLDVIEHIPDDLKVLQQAYQALKKGGYLFVTAPAFQHFWSYNDEAANHLRRYQYIDFFRLAEKSGLTLCDYRYFMFFLSPLYFLSRITFNSALTLAQKKELIIKQHKVPTSPINETLSAIFSLESPLGHLVKFPWGTSILGVFKKI